jgi:hypothetical protein
MRLSSGQLTYSTENEFLERPIILQDGDERNIILSF